MESVTIVISRRASFVGMAMPIKVLVNSMQVGQIKVGGQLQVIIPPKDCVLEFDMVGNNMNMRPIRGTFPLTVSKCKKGVITVDLSIKSNTLGILTSGMWQKLGEMKADIKYI